MMNRKLWDVAIIGAGPAGSTAAWRLADKGIEVLVLDKHTFPRTKPCGGALSNKVRRFLPFSLDSLEGDDIYGAEFSYKGRDAFKIMMDARIAKLVHRGRFDHLLLELSTSRGACFVPEEKVVDIRRRDDRLILTTSKGSIFAARVLIGADGPRGVSARYLNPGHTVPMGVALEEETRLDALAGRSWVSLDFGRFPWGYGWIFPKRGNASVGCGAIPKRKKISLKNEFERMKQDFNLVSGKGKGWLLPYFGDFAYKRADRQVLLVGDAARFVDPFLGEGIYYALASGTFAAESVVKTLGKGVDMSSLYQSLIQSEIIEELTHAVRMAEFVYPRIKLGFYALKRSERLGRLYVDVMSGKLPYKRFNEELFRAIKDTGVRKLKKLIFA